MKYYYMILLCMLLQAISSSKAQEKVKDVDVYLYNRIYKNIAAYNIKYGSFPLNGIIDNSPFYNTNGFFYEAFLPDADYKLKMKIDKMDWIYPIKEFEVYKIQLFDGVSFENKKEVITSGRTGLKVDEYFLVSLNKNNGDIKFISGQFFTSALSRDFNVSTDKSESYLLYLKFLGFRWLIRDIIYNHKQGKYRYFTCYSDLTKKKAMIVLNTEKPEYIRLSYEKKYERFFKTPLL